MTYENLLVWKEIYEKSKDPNAAKQLEKVMRNLKKKGWKEPAPEPKPEPTKSKGKK